MITEIIILSFVSLYGFMMYQAVKINNAYNDAYNDLDYDFEYNRLLNEDDDEVNVVVEKKDKGIQTIIEPEPLKQSFIQIDEDYLSSDDEDDF